MAYIEEEIEKKFWENVNVQSPDECWNWIGKIHKASGRGYFVYKSGRRVSGLSNRIAKEIQLNKPLDGFWVKDSCGNRLCCNPSHLVCELMEFTEDVFWEMCDKSDGDDACWPWKGVIDKDGCGRYKHRKKSIRANRSAYEFFYKEIIPSGAFACHKCDNPSCCNPRHIFIGTPKDNAVDRSVKGRGAPQHAGHNPYSKLKWDDVDFIRENYGRGWTQQSLAEKFNVTQPTVGRIIRNEAWVNRS